MNDVPRMSHIKHLLSFCIQGVFDARIIYTGLILFIYITIKYKNVVFELQVSLMCGPGSKFKAMETSSCHNL